MKELVASFLLGDEAFPRTVQGQQAMLLEALLDGERVPKGDTAPEDIKALRKAGVTVKRKGQHYVIPPTHLENIVITNMGFK